MARPTPDTQLAHKVRRWAEGRGTLKEVRGYTEEELYAIAQCAYYYYFQGKYDQARTLLQGLYAVDPTSTYFAKALAVVEAAIGNPQGALLLYDLVLRMDAVDVEALVGRAEIRFSLGQESAAIDDLVRAQATVPDEGHMRVKVEAMLDAFRRVPDPTQTARR